MTEMDDRGKEVLIDGKWYRVTRAWVMGQKSTRRYYTKHWYTIWHYDRGKPPGPMALAAAKAAGIDLMPEANSQ